MKDKKLGTNLQSLLEQVSSIEMPEMSDSVLVHVDLSKCHASQFQPRRHIDEKGLEELTNSIKHQGVIQPIVVRKKDEQVYEVIAGERRLLASKQAGLRTIPALVRKVSDEVAMAVALIENIQRQRLSVVDQALSLQKMADTFSWTHEQIAKAIGKSRSAVTNLLRLLNLEGEIISLLNQNQIEMGHARCLLALSPADQLDVASQIIRKNWSVRQTESYVQKIGKQVVKRLTIQTPKEMTCEKQLTQYLSFPVSVQSIRKNKGRIIIQYQSQEQLSQLMERLCRSQS